MMDFGSAIIRRAIIRRAIIALLIIQGVSSAFLLTLNALNAASEGRFALVVGVNLVALDMVIYIYRTMKLDDPVSRKWMAGGALMIALLVLTAVFLPG